MRILPLPALVAVLAVAPSLSAQSSVWKITRGENTIYLAGTCHVLRPGDFPLPEEFNAAYAASEAVYFETDIARVHSAEMQQVVAQHGLYQDGRTLESVVSPETWAAIRIYCERSGLPLGQVRSMKPWLFSVLMAATELQGLGVSAQGVDVHFFNRAKTDGKRIGALESFEQQVEFLTQLGAGHEDAMIRRSIEELAEMPEQIDRLLRAWREGDLEVMEQLIVQEVREKYPAIFEELFVSRNRDWLPQLEELLKTDAVEAVLVGVGHLAGEEGLLALLRERGCAIEQLVTQPAGATASVE